MFSGRNPPLYCTLEVICCDLLVTSGGGGWTSKTFEQVVDEEEAMLAEAEISPSTSAADFAKAYLSTRPNGYGGHRSVAWTVVARNKKHYFC